MDAAANKQVQVEKLEAEYKTKLNAKITMQLDHEAKIIEKLRVCRVFFRSHVCVSLPWLMVLQSYRSGLGTITQRPLWLVLTIIAVVFATVLASYLFRKSRYGTKQFTVRYNAER